MREFICFLLLSTTLLAEPFFFVLEPVSRSDRVFRMNMDGTTIPLGSEGALGYPAVGGLVWDWDKERLYGYDEQLHVWLQIDHISGTAEEIGPFELNPTNDKSIKDLTYNPDDGFVYALTTDKGLGNLFTNIYRIDQETGIATEIVEDGCRSNEGIAYAKDGIGDRSGFFVNGANCFGLHLFVAPAWKRIRLGGDIQRVLSLMWNPEDGKLYSLDSHSPNSLWIINQVTGNQTYVRDFEFGILKITIVPTEPIRDLCKLMDSDSDGDIDLEDFAAFQRCLTVPIGQTANLIRE